MSGPRRVAVLIDQLTRDAFSQLLVITRLRRAGVSVAVGNQATFRTVCERTSPHVIFGSLQATGDLMDYLVQASRRTHVVMVDQEGNKPGEETFKRAYTNSRRMAYATAATRIFCWGPLQKRWMQELGVDETKIAVTGNPRLDPYLDIRRPDRRRVSLTFRFDLVTGMPFLIMQSVHVYALNKGTRVGYPPWSSIEDQVWHKLAVARHMYMALERLAADPDIPIVVRPGPWEAPQVYQFMREAYPRVAVDPLSPQHDYVSGASVILDDCSTLGIEALATGVPVVSIQKAIPRLEDHIGGPGRGLFDAPYLAFYHQPKTVDEAAELVRRGHRGQLAASAAPGAEAYLKDVYDWPRRTPASFAMADEILKLLDVPAPKTGDADLSSEDRSWKRWAARHVPGAPALHGLRHYAECLSSPDRDHLLRYHYFSWAYPHHGRVAELYARLERLGG